MKKVSDKKIRRQTLINAQLYVVILFEEWGDSTEHQHQIATHTTRSVDVRNKIKNMK